VKLIGGHEPLQKEENHQQQRTVDEEESTRATGTFTEAARDRRPGGPNVKY